MLVALDPKITSPSPDTSRRLQHYRVEGIISHMSTDRTASLSHFAFMPVPNFTMIAFTNAIEVLRMANYLTGQTLYRWSIVSPTGGPVTASNGLAVDTGPVECVGQPDIVFVVGGIDVQHSTT